MVRQSLPLVLVCGAFMTIMARPVSAPADPGHGNPPVGHDAPAPKTAAPKPTATTNPPAKPKPASAESAKPEPAKAAPAASKPAADQPVDADTGPMTADKALALLQAGNARWVAGSPTNPHIATDRWAEVADKGQTPFVTVITCADSRLPVERLFDRGVGDVFVIRVAGNIAGVSETGTIEYGVGHLHTPLLVVMGHTRCGAVAAAAGGAEVHGKVRDLVNAIMPAVERVKRQNPSLDGKELAAAAVKENVWQTVFDLYRNSPEIRKLLADGKVKVVGAVCDIATGKVEWMGEHPWQGELLEALKARDAATSPANANAEPRGH